MTDIFNLKVEKNPNYPSFLSTLVFYTFYELTTSKMQATLSFFPSFQFDPKDYPTNNTIFVPFV